MNIIMLRFWVIILLFWILKITILLSVEFNIH
uniref:Uncharacterized protein n=1 Tax=Anguilla anguilla TaxID=7936 RepID=A0A0E9Q733_ANGAN